MAPTQSIQSRNLRKSKENIQYYRKYFTYEFAKSLVFDPEKLSIVSILILLSELILNIFIIQRIPYTEIDWIAYMQECEGFLNGTTNYAILKGDTGPLVYPAGFIYIYSALYFITSRGQNIRLAQYIFVVIYLLQMYLVLRLYIKSRKIPPYVMILSAFTSYRIHSIYILRLFNDPIAILFLYASINLFMDRKWTYGSICFSLGVSIKMNILLFAPGILILYITNLSYRNAIKQIMICALVQFSLGSPFLFTYPIAYLRASFDVGRVFEHKWTVNYRFLDKMIFENKLFHITLLILHLGLMALFTSPCYKYLKNYRRLRELQIQFQPQIDRENARHKKFKMMKKKIQRTTDDKLTKDQEYFLNSFEKSLKENNKTEQSRIIEEESNDYSINFDKSIQLALLPLFLFNFIGVACARSLHYQFYVWYFHSLPYLVWCTDFKISTRCLILGLIEYCWNTYPSTNISSILLHCCHIVLLIGIGTKIYKTNHITGKVQ